MIDEIKEILDYLKKEVNKFEESKTYLMETYNYREQDIENIEQHKKYVYFKKLLDYITNLQEENERLRKNQKLTPEQRNHLHLELDEVLEIYKLRNEKAIEYIERCRDYHRDIHKEEKIFPDEITSLLMILQGEDKQ